MKRYSASYQSHIMACVLQQKWFAARFIGLLKAEYFDDADIADAIDFCKTHFDAYKTIPSKESLVEYFDGDKSKVKPLYAQDTCDAKAVADEVAKYCRTQAVKNAILSSADRVKRDELEGVVDVMREAVMVGEDLSELGEYFVKDLSLRVPDYLYKNAGKKIVPTGMKHLDECLGGGLEGGELGVVMSPAKFGKSMFLANIAFLLSNSLHGLRVVYYSLEMKQRKILRRLDRRLCGAKKLKFLRDDPKEFVNHLERRQKRLLRGEILVKSYPTRVATANMLRAHLSQLHVMGYKPDVVIVDYGDIMRAERRMGEMRHEQAACFEDLRQLAGEFDVPVWTASQTNRKSLMKTTLNIDDIAECISGDTPVIDQRTGEYKTVRRSFRRGTPIHVSTYTGESFVAAKSNKWFDCGIKNTSYVKMEYGEPILVGDSHVWLTKRGWVKTSELIPQEDFIARARTLPHYGETCVDLCLAELLGYYAANGSSGYGYVLLSGLNDSVLWDRIRDGLNNYGVRLTSRCPSAKGGGVNYRISDPRANAHHHNRFSEILKRYGLYGKKSREKDIGFVYGWSRESVAAFLRGLFTGDGCVINRGHVRHVEYSSGSKVLIYQVRELLLRFGVFTTLKVQREQHGYADTYKLIASRSDSIRSYADIGFTGIKEERYSRILAKSRNLDERKKNRSERWTDLIVWSKVLSVDSAGMKHCYDLQIPEYHNHVLCGAITHNSFEKVQIADAVIAICATKDEQLAHRARLHLCALRDEQSLRQIDCTTNFAASMFMTERIIDPSEVRESDKKDNREEELE